MTPRSGIALFFLFSVAAVTAVGGCSKYGTTPNPTPIPSGTVSPFPDTLYVQDTSSKTIRVYKNASGINGFAAATLALSAPTVSLNDVVYSPDKNVLWMPSCAGAPCPGVSGPIDVYAQPTSLPNNSGPTSAVSLANIDGAAAYDDNHDFLYVLIHGSTAIQIYANASTLGTAGNTVPAGTATITMNDPQIQYSPPPSPQEIYYDKATDRLFVSDFGTVVAKFDGFGAAAATAVSGHTNVNLTATTQIAGLVQTDGMAYNSAQDILFVVSDQHGQLTVISQASTVNGTAGHAQTVTGFANPKGLAYDDIRNILFVYDPGNPLQEGQVLSFPNATTLSGHQNSWRGRKGFVDSFVPSLSGFGIAIDETH
jgi:hypothetical protein